MECVRLVYPKDGAVGVLRRLPKRTLEDIARKAAELDLRHDRRSATEVPVEEIRVALEAASGSVAKAARTLGCDAASLRRIAQSHGFFEQQASRPHWKTSEIEVLRQEYPRGGAPAVAARLPKRTISSIYRMASRLGLRSRG